MSWSCMYHGEIDSDGDRAKSVWSALAKGLSEVAELDAPAEYRVCPLCLLKLIAEPDAKAKAFAKKFLADYDQLKELEDRLGV